VDPSQNHSGVTNTEVFSPGCICSLSFVFPGGHRGSFPPIVDRVIQGQAKNGSQVAGVTDKKDYSKSMPPVVFVFYIFFDFLRESQGVFSSLIVNNRLSGYYNNNPLFHPHISWAQTIPDITTASIPPPGKVEALAKYRPFKGVLK